MNYINVTTKNIISKKRKVGKPKKEKIIFENLFDKSLKRKIQHFLESDTPVATLTKGLLIAAALGGVLMVGIVAPNLFKAFGTKQAYEKRSKRISKDGFSHLRRSCYQLQKKHWVEFVSEDVHGNQIFRVTDMGRTEIQKILKDISRGIARPEKWDCKWRLILFDIPVALNSARDALRYGLRSFGCYQIQRSAWVHPFPCVEVIKIMATKLNVQNYVEIYTIEDFQHAQAIASFRSLLSDHF